MTAMKMFQPKKAVQPGGSLELPLVSFKGWKVAEAFDGQRTGTPEEPCQRFGITNA